MKERINPPTIADKAPANVDPSNIVDLSKHPRNEKNPKTKPLIGQTEQLHGKVLIASTQEEREHAGQLLDEWWKKHSDKATDEAKRKRKRETAEPYEIESWADRVERSKKMKPPARIFDTLVMSDSVNIIYGYQNQGKSVIAEVIALIAAGERIEGVHTDPGTYKIILIDLEQPDISQQKWGPYMAILRKYNIKAVAIGDSFGGVDRDRLYATCLKAQQEGINFCIMDNLNRFFRLDVAKEDLCKQEFQALHDHVWNFFPHNLAAHHTTKLPAGPMKEIPFMAGSHIIADYVQGNLVFTARSWKDPDVVTFTHFKTKWSHIKTMKFYEKEDGITFALRRMGFNGDGLPFAFESNNHTFEYWQEVKDRKQVLEEAAEMERVDGNRSKRATQYVMEQLNVKKSRANDLLKNHSNEQ